MTKQVKLKMVAMPNFLSEERPAGRKQDGVNFGNRVHPVGELTKQEAEEYAEEMYKAFLEHWAKKKNELL